MSDFQIRQSWFIAMLVIAAAGLYILAGVLVNPFVLWTALPLYIGYAIVMSGVRLNLTVRQYRGMGFLLVGIGLSYLYHLAWFFDLDALKTGSSTSGLIFIFFPVYTAVISVVGLFIGPCMCKVSLRR